MQAEHAKLLIIGFGNPGRRDDGLGPAAATALEARPLPNVTIDQDYQLTVEDAAAVAEHGTVLFIDATTEDPAPFALHRVAPGTTTSFSTHSVKPSGVVALAEELFGAEVEPYLLAIRGYEFNEFGEGLSPRAEANLAAALSFIEPIILQRTFSEAVTASAGAPASPLAHGDH